MKAPQLQLPLECMRSWGLGGEAVPLETVAHMQKVSVLDVGTPGPALPHFHLPARLQCFPNVRVINSYGPTEVTALTVHHTFGTDESQVVIGRPDANTHAYVVDARLQSVPVGVPGELLLSGPRLGIGEGGTAQLLVGPLLLTCAADAHDLLCRLRWSARPDGREVHLQPLPQPSA